MSDAQTASTRGSLGHTLKALRETQSLTLADIASRLRLDPRVIAAIEADDHQALPTALYVRGYLRGYARILGTDPEYLVGLYNEEAPSVPPDILPDISRPSQIKSDDAPVRVATAAVVISLAVLLVVWWQTTYPPASAPAPKPAPAAPPAVAELKTVAPQSQLPYSYTVVTHPTSAYFRAPDVKAGGETGHADTGTQVAVDGGNARPASATGGSDQIIFRVTSDSWLEVTDRSGDRIYMDFIRGGESLTLTGQAPFAVLLGYAIGATLEFNGQPFDPAPFTRAGVARFSLGQ
jgi:cytoskeleton protein RodZ